MYFGGSIRRILDALGRHLARSALVPVLDRLRPPEALVASP